MELSRREVFGLFAASAVAAADEWIPLFNGTDLTGWKASEHHDSWKVREGNLWAEGPRSHLFYTAREFKNFELEVEALARPGCNSGVYFHTAYQESGFPIKGFEIQINNTATGEGTYRERKKTGIAVRGAQRLQAAGGGRPVVPDGGGGAREERADAHRRHAGGGLHRADAAGDPAGTGDGAVSGPRADSRCNATTKDRWRGSAACARGPCPTM